MQRFFRYALSGAFATLVHYAVLVLLVEYAFLNAPVASVVGAVCGAVAAYLANRRYTFASSSAQHAFPKFMLVALLGALFNGVVVAVCMQQLAWHYLQAQVLASVLALGLTYQLNRHWSFA